MMISSLFSVFDPVSSSFGVMNVGNWVFMLCPLFMINWCVFSVSGSVYSVIVILIKNINGMILQYTSTTNVYYILIVLLCLFVSVFWWNEMGLIPFGFSITSHLVINLSLSVVLFCLGVVFFLKFSGINILLAHIVPYGAPLTLSFVLVFVESVSFIIRPFTLAVRLVGNIVTGHLLIALLSELSCNLMFSLHIISYLTVLLGTGLLLFELAVSLVQAVIFVVLILIYWSE